MGIPVYRFYTEAMKRHVKRSLLCCLTVVVSVVSAAEPLPSERLVVRGLDGTAMPFADLLGPDGRAVCFAFLHPTCPLAQEYGPVLGQLAADFADEGIRFVGVVCESDDPAAIDAYRTKFGLTFPIHLDTDFTLAEALGATITPEAVLVDRAGRIRYAGRIDDRYKIRGVITPGDAEPELANAIQDLVAGREIREPRTKPAGCPHPAEDPAFLQAAGAGFLGRRQPEVAARAVGRVERPGFERGLGQA
jgi:thiol-disulfide isomerase/thioredoxin